MPPGDPIPHAPARAAPSPPRTRKSRKRKEISVSHHSLRCSVCHHPERQAIEQAFLQWRPPADLVREFKLGHRTAIYRHAHATGLVQRRASQMRHALWRIMEEAQNVKPTASSVIRAVRAHACLDEFGRWTEPPRRTIIEHVETCPSCNKRRRLAPEKQPGGEEKVNRYTRREKAAISGADSVR